jgi:RND superfamily putative drug exporter
MFARWGRFVFRHRRLVLAVSLVVLAASVVAMLNGGKLKDSNTDVTEAGRAAGIINGELAKAQPQGGSGFGLIFGSDRLTFTDPLFKVQVNAALARLKRDPRVTKITTPFDADVQPGLKTALESIDQRHVLVEVSLKDDLDVALGYYPELREKVQSPTLDVLASGGIAVQHDFNQFLGEDLKRAEYVSLPLSLILLLLVFAAVMAALMPVGVGAFTIIGGIAGVGLVARVTDVNQYAVNIVTLVGLGVSIDYSLFVVARFREELRQGRGTEEALERTMATAGRAITFSGLTVAIGLSGLLFYVGTFFTSLGIAGTVVVACAVFYSLTFLPAVLALLGPRVNLLRLPLPQPRDGAGFWHVLASWVMAHPLLVLVPTVAFIVVAGLPFRDMRLANGDITLLPLKAETRQAYELAFKQFPGRDQNFITVVADFPSGNPLSADHVGAVYDLSRRLARIPGVSNVQSIVDGPAGTTKAAYQALYAQPRAQLPADAQAALTAGTGAHITVLNVITASGRQSDAARNVVNAIRADRRVGDGTLLVSGFTAFDIDFIAYVLQQTPIAVAFILGVTYVVLFLLLGSVLLPLKAVVMNLLSLSASFGALVWIFQEGHFSDLLGFAPTSIDPTVPVLLFCIVFGLSMDYEVLLLSRMKEEFERGRSNRQAVAEGLERIGRLVSGAAGIMVAVFSAFALADVVLIKSIGLGMAIAVAIDATIVRALIVPATMRLLGDLNWWAPAPLARLQRRLGMGDGGSAAAGSGPIDVDLLHAG